MGFVVRLNHCVLAVSLGLCVALNASAKSAFEPNYSFLKPILSKQIQYQATPLLTGYFDILKGAKVGDKVIGRINLDDNRLYHQQNNGELYRLQLAQTNSGLKLNNIIDHKGRLFGELEVVDATQFNKLGNITIKVDLFNHNKKITSKNITVNIVDNPAYNSFAAKFDSYIEYHSRLNSRYRIKSKKQLNKIIKFATQNNGQLDFEFYGKSEQQKINIGKKPYGKQLAKASETIGGLAYAYKNNSDYKKAKQAKALKDLIYITSIRYLQEFPLQDFGHSKLLAHSDISHQWRFTDPLLGAISLIADDYFNDIDAGNPLALQLQQQLADFMQVVNFSLPKGYLEPSYPRYYMPDAKMLAYSNGAWADANRHHRQRSWMAQVLLSRDYNRPLTYLPYWYEGYKIWGENNTQVLPSWRPQGSFADIKTWLDTNTQLSHRYGQSGLLPDGSVSHHIGIRQDMAHVAYGFDWLANGITKAADILAGTPFAIKNDALETQRSFILFTYPKIMYKGSLDYQTAGRSHYADNLNDFADEVLIPTINKNLNVNAGDLNYTKDLKQLKVNLQANKETFHGSYAMWANDFVVHRNQAGQKPFYMSVKMQSARTKGAEGFARSSEYGFHNGSGVLQLKTHGKEYNQSRNSMDWHALPGLTEEWRSDTIPLSSKYKKYNPNPFSGSLAAEHSAMAAFHYDREDPYASAKAHKAWLFNNNTVWSLGHSINRTRKGQGKAIITTVEQASWHSDIHYQIADKTNKLALGKSTQQRFSTNNAAWFHQGDVGYIIYPEGELNLVLTTNDKINRSDKKSKSKQPVFHLAIDHGAAPQDAKYRYVSIANVSASEMPTLAKSLSQAQVINNQDMQALYIADELVQVVFHKPGSIQFNDGQSISSDQPALVQLKKVANHWQLAAADPLHSRALAKLTINTSIALPAGNYQYPTQGVDSKVLANQTISVSNDKDQSRVTVSLPSEQDLSSYNHRLDFYSGMPVVATLQ